MDNGLKNIIFGVIATAIISFIGAWVQINSRISVLAVQVENDHNVFTDNRDKSEKDMKELMNKVNDIQIKVTQLNDLKQNKY